MALEKHIWNHLSFVFLIAALWLSTHHYLGLILDARLYAVQALNALHHGQFSDDLYFKYGSQDQFTIFTFFYRACIDLVGLALSGIILLLFAHLIWVTSLAYLASGAIQNKVVALLGVAITILLPGSPVIPYGEAVLTPRLFSEALTMFALGALLRGKTVRAVLLLGISLPIHPLMTTPGLAVLLVHQIAKDRLWRWIGLACLVHCLALAFLGREPFVRLTATFDPEWFSIVRIRDYFCFITEWDISDWLKTGTTVSLAAYFLIVAENPAKSFLVEVLIVAIGGMLLTLVGGDLLHNVFVVDVQPWRSTWLFSVFTHLLIAPALLHIKNSRLSRNSHLATTLLIVTSILTGLSQFIAPIGFCGFGLSTVTAGVGTWEAVTGRAVPPLPRLAVVAFVGVASGFGATFLWWTFFVFGIPSHELFELVLTMALTTASVCLTVLLTMSVLKPLKCRVAPIPIFCLSLGLLIVSALNWDQRTPWTKFVETARTAPASLLKLLPPQDSVYWEGDVRVPWFVLQRASYFSCDQGTGVLFSRGTALEYERRYNTIEKLHTADFGRFAFCPAEGNPPMKRSKALQRDDLASVCRQQPGLDKLVLLNPVEGVTGAVWKTPVEFGGRILDAGDLAQLSSDRFFIYACADFR